MKLSHLEAARPSLRSWLLCLAAAVGLWLGFPNDFISFPPLVLAWPAALTLLGREASSRAQALRMGWLATIAGGIAALYWLTLPVHNVGGLPWLLAIPCALFIVACIGSVGGLFAVAAHMLRTRPTWVQAVGFKKEGQGGFWPDDKGFGPRFFCKPLIGKAQVQVYRLPLKGRNPLLVLVHVALNIQHINALGASGVAVERGGVQPPAAVANKRCCQQQAGYQACPVGAKAAC